MHRISFLLILILTWPLRWLPYSAIHRLGAFMGTCAFYTLPKFRKRTLNNLAIASSLQLTEEETKRCAIASLQNLMITCLEYAKFASEKQIDRVATCVNPEEADKLMKENKPVIFFCGHQSNWEILFLEGTSRMPGVAIGRPIKNKHLYNWILKIRQKFGGTMLAPQNAIREGLRGLKKGSFLGIVGDQGMPDSGYSSPFFGRTAWTSPIAAILSHRTGSPIMVATTKRREGRYWIHYSDPIWPDCEAPMEQEVDRLMKASLAKLEESIRESPGEWLWSHNRWKQQIAGKLKRDFRHESILIILPEEKSELDVLLPHLPTFRTIYPREFITIYAPEKQVSEVKLADARIVPYANEAEFLKWNDRFKLVFNFTPSAKVKPHFKQRDAFKVVSFYDIERLGGAGIPFSETLEKALLKTHAS